MASLCDHPVHSKILSPSLCNFPLRIQLRNQQILSQFHHHSGAIFFTYVVASFSPPRQNFLDLTTFIPNTAQPRPWFGGYPIQKKRDLNNSNSSNSSCSSNCNTAILLASIAAFGKGGTFWKPGNLAFKNFSLGALSLSVPV